MSRARRCPPMQLRRYSNSEFTTSCYLPTLFQLPNGEPLTSTLNPPPLSSLQPIHGFAACDWPHHAFTNIFLHIWRKKCFFLTSQRSHSLDSADFGQATVEVRGLIDTHELSIHETDNHILGRIMLYTALFVKLLDSTDRHHLTTSGRSLASFISHPLDIYLSIFRLHLHQTILPDWWRDRNSTLGLFSLAITRLLAL
jgi:hypothetical protein